MEISDKIKCLYDKDTKNAYANLQKLESISDCEDILYPYLNEFIARKANGDKAGFTVFGVCCAV